MTRVTRSEPGEQLEYIILELAAIPLPNQHTYSVQLQLTDKHQSNVTMPPSVPSFTLNNGLKMPAVGIG
jgi:hypothetical protein